MSRAQPGVPRLLVRLKVRLLRNRARAQRYGTVFLVGSVVAALVFGLVNGTLGKVVRVVSIPLYILTLGLFGLIVNGFLLWVVAWLSGLAGFGLAIGGFWWGVLAALVLSLLSGILNGLLGTNKKKDR